MFEWVPVAAGVAAGLACPAHMWWRHRRGQPGCLTQTRAPADGRLGLLCERQRQLAQGIAVAVEQQHVEEMDRG